VFYPWRVIGFKGRAFTGYKFTTMTADADERKSELGHLNEMRGPVFKIKDDPRVTNLGRFLRKFSVNELPQLWSVLKGDMSLVGPRPERPYFVDKLTQELPYYAVRQSVKPGVTGWAQVRYHYGASVEDAAEKLQYDLYYVKNHSLFLDLVVLFETVGVVLMGKGAR